MEVTITRVTPDQVDWNVAVQTDEITSECFKSLEPIVEDIEAIIERDKEISEIIIKYD
jgi:hypothetical protein